MAKKLWSSLLLVSFLALFISLAPHEVKAVACETFSVSPLTGDPATVFTAEARGCNNEGEASFLIELDVLVVAPDGFESYFTSTPAQDSSSYEIHATVAGFVVNNQAGTYSVTLRQRQGQGEPIVIGTANITITVPQIPTPSDDPNSTPPPPAGPQCGEVCSQGSTCGLCPEGCTAARSVQTYPDGSSQVIWRCEYEGIAFTGICGTHGINTAIGCIPTGNLNNFAAFFLRWGLGISGGVAIVMLIYSSLLIVTSAGDLSKIASGKELLTSTISGIFLLVFCVFVLRIIGVNVLGIF